MTEETKEILEREGFNFECRGEIDVKGKGLMTTYLLVVPQSCAETDAEELKRRKSMNGDLK